MQYQHNTEIAWRLAILSKTKTQLPQQEFY